MLLNSESSPETSIPGQTGPRATDILCFFVWIIINNLKINLKTVTGESNFQKWDFVFGFLKKLAQKDKYKYKYLFAELGTRQHCRNNVTMF